MSRNLDNSARIVFGLMGFFLVLFIISILLTTLGDDTVGAARVNVDGVVEQINAGKVEEINQRNGIQMIIMLKNKDRLIYFRPANTPMTDVLLDAGITQEQLTNIKFTSGEQPNTLSTIGGLVRLFGLAGLGTTAVLGYFQRRKQVLGSGRRLR